MFLAQGAGELSQWDFIAFAGLAISFAFNHGVSYRQNIEADVRGRPNLGVLLKTVADVLMHKAEHAMLQKGSNEAGRESRAFRGR